MKSEVTTKAMVRDQVVGRRVRSRHVIGALLRVDRRIFVPAESASLALGDHPVSIACGQTVSQPYMVALMLDALQVRRGMKVLEVGAGSGYVLALLSAMGARPHGSGVAPGTGQPDPCPPERRPIQCGGGAVRGRRPRLARGGALRPHPGQRRLSVRPSASSPSARAGRHPRGARRCARRGRPGPAPDDQGTGRHRGGGPGRLRFRTAGRPFWGKQDEKLGMTQISKAREFNRGIRKMKGRLREDVSAQPVAVSHGLAQTLARDSRAGSVRAGVRGRGRPLPRGGLSLFRRMFQNLLENAASGDIPGFSWWPSQEAHGAGPAHDLHPAALLGGGERPVLPVHGRDLTFLLPLPFPRRGLHAQRAMEAALNAGYMVALCWRP